MNEEGKFLLFMPIIVSSLTNAVYTCRQLNPELNPEQAIADVILTWERMSSILSASFSKDAEQGLKISQFLSSELQRVQSQMQVLSVKLISDPESQKKQIELLAELQLIQKIVSHLNKT